MTGLGAKAEILPFTALRGLAAWWVALYHIAAFLPVGGALRAFVLQGPLAVDLFFIMSGFVMMLSYGGSFAGRPTSQGVGRFIGLRLARIYPLHCVTLLLFVSVPLTLLATGRTEAVRGFAAASFAQNLFLTQNWFSNDLDWNVPAWSISTELLFYLLFPAITWAVSKAPGLPATSVLTLATLSFIAAVHGPGRYTADFGPARCLPECFLGMLLFRAAGARPRLVPGALLAAAALLIGLVVAGLAADQDVMPLAFALLLWSLLDARFWLSRLLSNRFLLFLGQISFSTYLVHFLVKAWLKFLLVGNIPDWAACACYVVCVLGFSWVLHHAVELPGRRAGRALTELLFRRSAAGPVPAAPLSAEALAAMTAPALEARR